MGKYYIDGEVYEKAKSLKLSNDTIILDGSNVAWNRGDRKKGDKPKAINIQLVIDELKKEGYKKIKVIADANLFHDIEDRDIFNKLKQNKIIKEVPGRTEADEFIIKYAKEKDARIITLDKFKKWKEQDPWVKEYIDRHLVKFMIEDNVVKLYGLHIK